MACSSPSSRRAWIEIFAAFLSLPGLRVALLAEGVDRNILPQLLITANWVALLAEGVDRNTQLPQAEKYLARMVALLAEGVDRNQQGHDLDAALKVALLAEGVDRNCVSSLPVC